MARIKRAVNAQKKRRKMLKLAGYCGQIQAVPCCQRAGSPFAPLRLRWQKAAQARFPPPVDHPHQRSCPPQRHQLFQAHQRPEEDRRRDQPQNARGHGRQRRQRFRSVS